MVRSVAAASSFQPHARLRLAESLTLSSLRSKCAAMMKGAFLFCQMRSYLLRGHGSREQGADGFFVLREVALDCGQVEGAEDARVRFALKEELE
jgi:hypothetical protein